MAKDSYWFKHDSNAGRDLKLLEITHIYTHWGKGVFWDVIEVLREQDGYKFDKNKLQILCSMIMCLDLNKFKNWYKDCLRLGLFVENDGYFYSESLIDRMEKWEILKSNGSKGGRPKKTKTKPDGKPKQNQKPNQNKTIIGDKSIEEYRIEEENIEDTNLFTINSEIYLNSLVDYFKHEFIIISFEELKKEANSFVNQKIAAGDIHLDFTAYANHFINKIKKSYRNIGEDNKKSSLPTYVMTAMMNTFKGQFENEDQAKEKFHKNYGMYPEKIQKL